MNFLTGMLRSFGRSGLNKQLVIPMSGTGARFIAAGYRLPKPLIEVAGKPIIQHVLEMYPNWENILFIVNSEHFNDKALNLEEKLLQLAPTSKIHVTAPHKLGPTHAVLEARDSLISEGPIVINYCDFAGIFDLEEFEKKIFQYDSVLLTYTGFHPHMLTSTKFAYLKEIDNKFVDIQEKQSYTDAPMEEEASAGAYSFRNKQLLLDSIATQIESGFILNDELYTSLTVKALIQNGGTIASTLMSKFFQWGTPEDLEEFEKQRDYFAFRNQKRVSVNNVDRAEILAAGAGQRFIDAGYKEHKPFLPCGESFLALEALSALGAISGSKGLLLQESFSLPNAISTSLQENGVVIELVDGLTKGQAASALLALTRVNYGNCIIATCDSLVFPRHSDKLASVRGKTLGAWVVNPSFFAKSNAAQFGWVNVNDKMEIIKSWVKIKPDTRSEVMVIAGTFIFGDSAEAKILLSDFISTGNTVNGEYYLDSVLSFAAGKGWTVLALEPEWFVSLGTPNEYETYQYWSSVFEERKDLLESNGVK